MSQPVNYPEEFWNSRYSDPEYVYGKKPNEFFAEQLLKLSPGNLLLPADGEGRNAVFAAKSGWFVDAYDISEQGRSKAAILAKEEKVTIRYEISSHEYYKAPTNFFDCIALIYVHIASKDRTKFHEKILSFLKPGGTIILEAFNKKQLGNPSGGPDNEDMLYNIEILQNDFSMLDQLEIGEYVVQLDEGNYHKGKADVVRMTGIKLQ